MRVVVVVLVLIVVCAIGAAGFVGYELYQVAANPTAAPPLPTVSVNGRQVVDFSSIPPDQLAGAVRSAQDKLDQNVKDKQAFALDLTGSDLIALVVAQAGESARAVPVTDVSLDIRNGGIALTANLRGTVPVPVAGTLTPSLQQGQLKLHRLRSQDWTTASSGRPDRWTSRRPGAGCKRQPRSVRCAVIAVRGDVHPNAQGYQAIAFAFTNVLKKP